MGSVGQSNVSSSFLRAEASRCVSCGLCLPHCPTYRLTMSEADSPRGRIQMMNGVVNGHIPLNKKFVQHMDRCLTCRACEAVCPNDVAYGQLIDEARAMIVVRSNTPKGASLRKKHRLRVLLENEFIAKPTRFDFLRSSIRLFQKMGLQQWLQKSKFLKKTSIPRLVSQLPVVKQPFFSVAGQRASMGGWKKIYPAIGKQRGEVGLFLGCVARLADVVTLNSAIYVLNRLGYLVHIPSAQTCCGAIHQHGGDLAKSAILARQNKEAFETLNLCAVVTTASGCGVQLSECQLRQTSTESECDKKASFSSTITDISKFLVTAEGWDDVEIAPLSCQVVVHDPCSLRHVLNDQSYPYALLARIPNIQILPLAGNDQCCGAAGTYFLDQPEMASKLQADKVSAVEQSEAHFIATSNIGCSLYIGSGLQKAALDVEVLHPVTLLARQMGIQ